MGKGWKRNALKLVTLFTFLIPTVAANNAFGDILGVFFGLFDTLFNGNVLLPNWVLYKALYWFALAILLMTVLPKIPPFKSNGQTTETDTKRANFLAWILGFAIAFATPNTMVIQFFTTYAVAIITLALSLLPFGLWYVTRGTSRWTGLLIIVLGMITYSVMDANRNAINALIPGRNLTQYLGLLIFVIIGAGFWRLILGGSGSSGSSPLSGSFSFSFGGGRRGRHSRRSPTGSWGEGSTPASTALLRQMEQFEKKVLQLEGFYDRFESASNTLLSTPAPVPAPLQNMVVTSANAVVGSLGPLNTDSGTLHGDAAYIDLNNGQKTRFLDLVDEIVGIAVDYTANRAVVNGSGLLTVGGGAPLPPAP